MPTPERTRFLFIYFYIFIYLFIYFTFEDSTALFVFFLGKEGGGENFWREAVRGERRRCWLLDMSS